MIWEQESYNQEQRSEWALVVSVNDEQKGQHRVKIQPLSLSGVTDTQKLPWAKCIQSTNAQVTDQSISNMESVHSLTPGCWIMVNRPTASGGDYTIGYSGHQGSIIGQGGGGGGSTSDANFQWKGSQQFTKKTHDKTTIPADDSVSIQSPGNIQLETKYQHVRDRAKQKLQTDSQFSQDASRLFKNAKHIGNAVDKNKVTKLIQQKDPQGGAESTQNIQVAQMLDKMRDSLNQIPQLKDFMSNGQQGIMSGIQSMIGGGNGGMGTFLQLIQMATQAGQNMNNHNSNANTANKPYLTEFLLDANNTINQLGPTATP